MRMRTYFMVVGPIVLAFLFVCCGAAVPPGALQIAPEDDFNITLGLNAKQLLESGVFKRLREEIKEVGDGFERMKQQGLEAGIDIERIKNVTLAFSQDQALLAHATGDIDAERFATLQEKTAGVEYKKESEGDRTYWSCQGRLFLTDAGGGLAAYSDVSVMKESLEVISGKAPRLADDPDLRAGLELVDTGATVYVLIWENFKIDGRAASRALSILIDDAKVVEEVVEALDDVDAAGFSLRLTDGLAFRARARLDQASDAERLAEIFNDVKGDVLERAGKQAELLGRLFSIPIDAERIASLSENLRIAGEGRILRIDLDVRDLDWIIETIAGAMEKGRQRTTMNNIKELGYLIECYKCDFPSVGAPKAADMEELRRILQKCDYILRDPEAFTSDGWGRDLVYQCDGALGAGSYTLVSYGADGAPGPEAPLDEASGLRFVTKLEEDIIFSNGVFLQHPQ